MPSQHFYFSSPQQTDKLTEKLNREAQTYKPDTNKQKDRQTHTGRQTHRYELMFSPHLVQGNMDSLVSWANDTWRVFCQCTVIPEVHLLHNWKKDQSKWQLVSVNIQLTMECPGWGRPLEDRTVRLQTCLTIGTRLKIKGDSVTDSSLYSKLNCLQYGYYARRKNAN